MKKRNYFIAGVSALMMTSALVGCGTSGGGNSSSGGSSNASSTGSSNASSGGSSSSSGTAKLTLWDIQTGAQQKVIQNMVDSFNKANPNINVTAQFFENDPFKQKLQIAMGAHNAPDIWTGWGGGVLKSYIDAGDVYDLTSDLNSDSSWKNRFLPSVMAPVTFNGKVYGVPNDNVQPVMFFYSKPLFKKYNVQPPKTWNDLLADVKLFKSKGVAPIALGGKDQWPDLMYEEYLVDRIGGPQVFDNVIAGKKGAWSDPAFIKANTMIQQLAQAGAFESGFSSVSSNQGQDAALIYTNKAAMWLMGAWGFGNVLSNDKNFIDQGNLGFFSFPTVSGGQGNAADIAGNPSNYYSISNDSKNKQAAVTFLKKAVLNDQNVKDWISIGDVPPVTGIESDLKSAKYSDYMSFTYDLVKNAPNFQASWDQALSPAEAQELLTDLSKLFLGQMTPKQLSDDMNSYIGK